MEKDKSVQNQKVFITLAGYTRLAAEYNRVVDEINNADPATNMNMAARKQGLEFAIEVLGLPIERRMYQRRVTRPLDKPKAADVTNLDTPKAKAGTPLQSECPNDDPLVKRSVPEVS